MRQKFIRLILFFLILITIISIVYAYAANTFMFSSSGTIEQVKGQVFIIRAGENTNRPVVLETVMQAGDTIEAYANGYAVVKLKNGEEITILPGQRFTLLSIFDTNKELGTDLQVFSTLKRTFNIEAETSNTITTTPG